MIEKAGRKKWRFICTCGYWSQWRNKKLAREDGARHLAQLWQYPIPNVSPDFLDALRAFRRAQGYRTLEQQRIEQEVNRFRKELEGL